MTILSGNNAIYAYILIHIFQNIILRNIHTSQQTTFPASIQSNWHSQEFRVIKLLHNAHSPSKRIRCTCKFLQSSVVTHV